MRLPSLRTTEPGFWLSGAAHAALLGAGLVAFTSAPLPDAVEGIPVEVITDNQYSEITRGEITASKVQPNPSLRVDRQADTRVERDPGEAKQDVPSPPRRPVEMKVADEEVAPPPAAAPPPARPDTAKAEAAAKAAATAAAAAAKAEAVKLAQREEAEEMALAEKAAQAERARAEAQARARADAKAKQEADAKAKAELDAKMKAVAEAESKARAEAKAKADAQAKAKAFADAKAKSDAEAKAKKQAELADKFDPGSIKSLLASKEPAQSSGSTGREVQKTASLGTATGNAQRLNPSQRSQISGIIREQLIRCWQPPVAVTSSAKPPTAVIRLAIKQDGSLMSDPVIQNSSSDPLFRPVAESALRATRRCAPLRIPAQFAPFYQDWKDLVVDFDPREMG